MGTRCRQLQSDAGATHGCITVKDAPVLLSLNNWGAGHRVTPGCEIGVSDVVVQKMILTSETRTGSKATSAAPVASAGKSVFLA
mmetsp:Transcript_111982/g.280580  ORF Transcript_111982/g.280580 Transcript_111982/m.280580 type:complete len:84 (+) Transcript_111982:161-412(+)